jgi:hypothetical protein
MLKNLNIHCHRCYEPPQKNLHYDLYLKIYYNITLPFKLWFSKVIFYHNILKSAVYFFHVNLICSVPLINYV